MTKKIRKVISLLLIVMVGTATVACGPKNKEENIKVNADIKKVELLRIGTTNNQDGFNATEQNGILGRINYTGFCQGNMFVVDDKLKLEPGFLESYEISDDNKKLTLKIPKNGKWHDGKPVTIEDIKFTFEYNRDVIASSAYMNIEKLEIVGDNTIIVTFNDKLTAFAFVNSASTSSKIYPKHIWEKVDKPKEYNGKDANIGCGPFKLTEVDHDGQISYYDAVPNYCKGDVSIKKVMIKSYANHEALAMGMINNEVDCMYDYNKPVPSTLYDIISKSKVVNLALQQDPGNKMLMMGFRSKPTDDLAFREAISYIFDYKMLALTVGGKEAKIGSRGIIPPTNKGFNSELETMTTDFAKASELLDKAGYVDKNNDGYRDLKDGSEMNIIITPQYNKSSQEIFTRIGNILVDSLKKAGIKATFEAECSTNKEAWSKRAEQQGDYNIHIGYCTSGMSKYKGAPYYLVDSSINKWWGTCKDEEFLKSAVDDFNKAKSFQEYGEVMKKTQKIISDKVIGIPVCWETTSYPHRTDKYEGWVNVPGEGVINYSTWFKLKNK